MKEYEIWSEGYRATCEHGTATFHGKVKASSFKEACDIHFEGNSTYDPERMTYWACKLFDNEKSARRSFG